MVTHFLDLPFESVSIGEDEESLGRCFNPLPEGFEPDEHSEGSAEPIEKHLAACMAGAAAQEIFTGEFVNLRGNNISAALHLVQSTAGTFEQMEARLPIKRR